MSSITPEPNKDLGKSLGQIIKSHGGFRSGKLLRNQCAREKRREKQVREREHRVSTRMWSVGLPKKRIKYLQGWFGQ